LPFERESLATIRDRVLRTLETEHIPYSFRGLLAQAIAGLSHMLHSHLAILSENMLADTAQGVYLDRWALLFGVARKEATKPRIKIRARGTPDSPVPLEWTVDAGVWLREENLVYPKSGEIEFYCESKKPTEPLPRAQTKAQPLLIQKDTDDTALILDVIPTQPQESDESLRRRIKQALCAAPQGGSPLDFIQWTESIPGVKKAFVRPASMIEDSPGSVWVSWIQDGLNQSLEVAIKNALKEKAPAHARVLVVPFQIKTIPICLEVRPNTKKVREDVRSAIERFFDENRAPAGFLDGNLIPTPKKIPLSKLSEAISRAQGEESHAILEPLQDIELLEKELPQCQIQFV
jgi:uncharacterized phage protein gp47/JayE